MNVAKAIKKLIIDRDTTQTDLAPLLGMSRANFAQLLAKKDFRITGDIERIANALDYDVELYFVDRKTGNKIKCDD